VTLPLPQSGGCACEQVRFQINAEPLFVHCCHCTWCQRETGAAFAVNALIEASEVALLRGNVVEVHTPSNSGEGQVIARCADCQVALWSNYAAARGMIRFVRVGSLDNAALFPPDIHIFTSTKQPWVRLEAGTPTVAEYYRRSEHWPDSSIERYNRAIGRVRT
jgi:hypothetical protein